MSLQSVPQERIEAILPVKILKKAFIKVGIGTEKKSKVISEKEKLITAYHEAGHAILFHVLPDVGPLYIQYQLFPPEPEPLDIQCPFPKRMKCSLLRQDAPGYYCRSWG